MTKNREDRYLGNNKQVNNKKNQTPKRIKKNILGIKKRQISKDDVAVAIGILVSIFSLSVNAAHVTHDVRVNHAASKDIDDVKSMLSDALTYADSNGMMVLQYQQDKIANDIEKYFDVSRSLGNYRLALVNDLIMYPDYNMPIVMSYIDDEYTLGYNDFSKYISELGFSDEATFYDIMLENQFNNKEKEGPKL